MGYHYTDSAVSYNVRAYAPIRRNGDLREIAEGVHDAGKALPCKGPMQENREETYMPKMRRKAQRRKAKTKPRQTSVTVENMAQRTATMNRRRAQLSKGRYAR